MPSAHLLYHRIDTPIADRWTLAVSPQRFAEHLAVLRDRFRPLPRATLIAALRAGSLPAGAVALTFDVGYADNLLQGAITARPVRDPRDRPRDRGLSRRNHEFWCKQVEQLLLERANFLSTAVPMATLSPLTAPRLAVLASFEECLGPCRPGNAMRSGGGYLVLREQASRFVRLFPPQ